MPDLRDAFRTLRHSPGLAVTLVLTLALGIGANTVVFSLVSAVLLAPLPYRDAERIVRVFDNFDGLGLSGIDVSAIELGEYRSRLNVFEALAAYSHESRTLTGAGEPERVRGAAVTPDLFAVLGVAPVAGRSLEAADAQGGREPVVVISHALWQQRFAASPSALGQRLRLNGQPVTIVGVLPPGVLFPSRDAVYWTPLIIGPDQLRETSRGSRSLSAIGRLRAGVGLEAARAVVARLASQLGREHPGDYDDARGFRLSVTPLRQDIVGDLRGALLLLSGAVAFVLLIACANVASVMLVRAAGRHREFAVRAALGASRSQLARLVLVESTLVSVAGAALALLFSLWIVEGLRAMLPPRATMLPDAQIDLRVMGFTAAITACTAMLFGLAPALTAWRTPLADALRPAGPARNRGRLRQGLVVAEIALALVLLTGAGLMFRSFARLRAVAPGFDSWGALSLQLTMAEATYPTPEAKSSFMAAVLEGVRTLPVVSDAGAVLNLPLGGGNWDWSITIDGRPSPSGVQPQTDFNVVTPGYFDAMRIPLHEGRAISGRDLASSPRVVVVSEAFARAYFDDRPLGGRIKLGGVSSPNPWLTIVGVVGDIRPRGLHVAIRPMIYVPYSQVAFPLGSMTVVARASAGPPRSLAAPITEVIRALDKDQPVSRVATLTDVLDGSLSEPRFSMMLIALFAVAALALATIGVYGTMAYTATVRVPEIGIRMALGARRGDVLVLLLRQGLTLAVVGIALGVAGSALLTSLLETRLYDLSPRDPATFAATAALLVLVALAAVYIPAHRATRVDPVTALRWE